MLLTNNGSRSWTYDDAVGQVNKGTNLPSETKFVAAAEAIALAKAAVKVAKSAAKMMMNVKQKSKQPDPDNSIDRPGLQIEEMEPTVEELKLIEEQLSSSGTERTED